MSYLIAAYVVTLGVIALYWARLALDRRVLREAESASKSAD